MDYQKLMDYRRKKLLFQSQHRGTKEVDMFLGNYAKRYINEMSEQELSLFGLLLDEKDLDLYNWISGKRPLPERLNHQLMQNIRAFNVAKY